MEYMLIFGFGCLLAGFSVGMLLGRHVGIGYGRHLARRDGR